MSIPATYTQEQAAQLKAGVSAKPPIVLDVAAARIGVIGLGYVGLPLAAAFGRRYPTVGFDIDPNRIRELQAGHDRTREVLPDDLGNSRKLRFASEVADIAGCN